MRRFRESASTKAGTRLRDLKVDGHKIVDFSIGEPDLPMPDNVIVAEIDRPDAVLIHLNLPVLLSYRHVDMLGNVLKTVADLKTAHGGRTQFALVLRSDGEREIERRKQACRLDAMRDGIQAFDFAEAATAQAALGFRLRFLARPR